MFVRTYITYEFSYAYELSCNKRTLKNTARSGAQPKMIMCATVSIGSVYPTLPNRKQTDKWQRYLGMRIVHITIVLCTNQIIPVVGTYNRENKIEYSSRFLMARQNVQPLLRSAGSSS